MWIWVAAAGVRCSCCVYHDPMSLRIRLLVGLLLLAVAFAVDRQLYLPLRTLLLWEHWGEMQEALGTAKFLGSGLGTVVIGLIVGSLDPRGWRRVLVLWLMVACVGVAAGVIKVATGRERPSHLDQPPGRERLAFLGPARGLEAPFQSFPSGHAASSFATATCLASYYPPARVVFYVAASATALNRVVKHQHFPSDVIAGAMLGHLLVAWLLRRPRIRRWWQPVDRKHDPA